MARKHTETIDSKLKTAWQIISRMYNAEAVKHDITIAIGHFLLNVDSQQGAFASDIAPRLGTEDTSLSRLIASLEQTGLIERMADKTDKRRIKILLTEKGRQKKEVSKTVVRNFNRLAKERIGKEKIETFLATLDEITNLAKEQHDQLK
jgi:DNA-binding MarR family transcriptional regulator